MQKKSHFVFTIIFTLILLLGIAQITPSTANATSNIIIDGSFEEGSSGLIKHWSTDVYNSTNKTSFTIDTSNPHSGKYCLKIQSGKAEDAKIIQKVTVKPDTTYKISCWVKVEEVGDLGKGANVSALNITDTSLDIKGTTEGWTEVILYGKTGEKQTEISITGRLGGYGAMNYGIAYFDDFSIIEASAIPSGVTVANLLPEQSSSEVTTSATKIPMALPMAILLLFWLGFVIVRHIILKDGHEHKLIIKAREKIFLTLILTGILLLRVLLAPRVQGYTGDINLFLNWAQNAAKDGLANFYTGQFFVDYPPGYIYILYIIGKLQLIFNISQGSMLVLIKLPAILADVAATYFIYTISRKHSNANGALLIALLYGLNPAVIINSAIWGQVDGFYTLFIAAMTYYAFEGKLVKASLIFVIAVLVKPQALIFTPVLLYAFIKAKSLRTLLISGMSSLALFVILLIPFSINQNILWIVNKYTTTLASYPFASVNAFNLFTLFGGNWISDKGNFLFLSYSTWSTLFILATVAFSGFVYFKSNVKSKGLFISAFIIVSVFVMCTKMHERYMFPAMILTLIWYIHSQEKYSLFAFAALTSTIFINHAYILKAAALGIVKVNQSGIVTVTSIVNIGILIYFVATGIRYATNKTAVETSLTEAYLKEEAKIEKQLKKKKVIFDKKDFILAGILVVFYAIIAIVNLGTTKVPQTYWQPEAIGDSFYIDLGKTENITKAAYFAGLGEGQYLLSFSEDAENWENELLIAQESIYVWKSTAINYSARYVKLQVLNPDGMLNELAFYGDNTKTPLKIKKIEIIQSYKGDVGKTEYVFDEQAMATLEASYLNGTYFDEIYHARTAFESLHLLQPYEWTHPPLGKLFIAIGVYLFGMNPFGWRVIGTLFGIAYIPFMYALGKRLFRKREYAFLTAFLMTFDFMHFTQTRIATVDSYAVFFIILMYYYMFKYTDIDVYEKGGLKKALLALGLSGLFFGLGAASKWICLYSAAGLAIIFFKNTYDKYIQYKFAREYSSLPELDMLSEKYVRTELIKYRFKINTLITLLFCVIVFITIPIGIYIASYIPFMMIPGPGHTLMDVIKLQKQMYDYHENLVATHPFQSPWYQWPFIIKPIWYYSGQGLATGKMSSIVAMGNPAIWWTGAIAAFAVFYIGIKKVDKVAFFILIGGLSQFVPWMFVPRITFIYHYFATVPFIILCIVYVTKYAINKYPSWRTVKKVYMIIVVLLFIVFYPIISGATIDTTMAHIFLRWFNSWIF